MPRSRLREIIAAALIALALGPIETVHARAATLPFAVGADQGVFLHISDVHFDPFADPSLVPRLIAAPAAEWQGILSSKASRFAQYRHDTNYPLLMSMLAAAKGIPYDYIVNTGDNLAHRFHRAFQDAGGKEEDYPGFVLKTMLFVDEMLKQSFPDVPLISALGNNDATCGDYKLEPGSSLLTSIAHDLPVVRDDEQAYADFKIGGFYAVPHPTVPRHDIIVLSDVFWSAEYRDACGPHGGDPGAAELAWLEWKLYQARLAGRSVTLVMHIPPGIDSYSSARGACPGAITSFWRPRYAARFAELVEAYKDVLRGSYAGHTHMDDFRVLSDRTGEPFLATRIAPAVSPVFNNNPAFTVLLYNKADASVSDYATFYLANLAQLGQDSAAATPAWTLEYTFTQAYGIQNYDPAALASLATRIRADASVRSSYMRYYAAEAPANSPIDTANWSAYSCAQSAITAEDYAACQCPGTR